MSIISFDNRYFALGESFYNTARPTPVAKPELIQFNEALARKLDIFDQPDIDTQFAGLFSGNIIPEGAASLAMAYAGHQFGHFSPELGDGRALLLGEVLSPVGDRFHIHMKGTGRTAYSRNGDGRSALGPVLREYLISEAMAKLGVPTTRALAAVSTGEDVFREKRLPGGVITRVASSFIRVGTFEYFAARGDLASVKKLADYVITNQYPDTSDSVNPYAALLQAVVDRQAALIARWMQLGFIHGVMNTDNMSISGETIDYGPCAFMDDFDYHRVYSSIDHMGRYAYANQPSIGLWNLTRLAETLAPLIDPDLDKAVDFAKDILGNYMERYEQEWLSGMQAKCGFYNVSTDSHGDDKMLIDELLDLMSTNHVDFTLMFTCLSRLPRVSSRDDIEVKKLFENPELPEAWLMRWRERLLGESINDPGRQERMQAVNPVYIPRNHLVEAAIRAAEDHQDYSVFYELHDVLQDPYREQAGRDKFKNPPEPHQVVTQTFCGT